MTNRPHDQALRIWSAGCASGAEAYSVAILLHGDFADQPAGRRFSILGTDINRKAVSAARAGLYSSWELRATPEEQRRQWFDPVGGNWSIRPEFRQGVAFAQQNLVTDIDAFTRAHAGTFDVIFCRNVMIYFDSELMRHLLLRFSECLARGGWLFVGHAEPYFEIANYLAPVPAAGAAIYRKPDSDLPTLWPAPAAPSPWSENPLAEAGNPYEWPAMHMSPPPETSSEAAALPPEIRMAPSTTAADAIRRQSDSGNWAAAIHACDQALRQHPMDAALHYAHALICEHMGTPAVAEQALRQALYLDRGFALAHYHLGRSLAARGDRQSAARSFANALKVVAGRDAADALTMGDGLTVAEFRELTRCHLDLLERQG